MHEDFDKGLQTSKPFITGKYRQIFVRRRMHRTKTLLHRFCIVTKSILSTEEVHWKAQETIKSTVRAALNIPLSKKALFACKTIKITLKAGEWELYAPEC